jgi:hypothetical protein
VRSGAWFDVPSKGEVLLSFPLRFGTKNNLGVTGLWPRARRCNLDAMPVLLCHLVSNDTCDYRGEMKIREAIALIRTHSISWGRPQSWRDLGCGSGMFTTALARLAPGSTIHAFDLDQTALDRIQDQIDGATFIRFWRISGALPSAFPRWTGSSGPTPYTSLRINACS